jgi:hypothetical protein
MKIKIALLLLFHRGAAFAQDTIVTFGAKRFAAEIISKSGDSIKFKSADKKGKQQLLHKNWIALIKYANGTSESFFTEAEKAMPIDVLKAKIVETISAHAYEVDSNKQQYHPEFIGDYMVMPLFYKGKQIGRPGFLYDFSRVYEYQPVSERNDIDAYINIILDFQEKPGKSKWKKQKLVMRIKGHQEAHEIFRLLQNYNRVLLDKKLAVK